MKKWLLVLSLFCQTFLRAQETDITKEVEEVIRPFMQKKKIEGVAVALYYNGKSYLINFGLAHPPPNSKPVTADTVFEIASITKVFTSTALAVNILAGKMQLKDPITKYLPQIRRKNIPLERVTLQHLATHNSSIPRVPEGKRVNTPPELMRYFENWTPKWPVGSRYLYSNIGFGLLGYALEETDHRPFMQILEMTILNPLGMRSTVMRIPPNFHSALAQGFSEAGKAVPDDNINAWPAGGALRSTSRDMLAFLEANLGVRGPPALLQAMQLAQQGLYKVNDKLTLGMGWQRFNFQGVLMIDKNGGLDGFSSYIGMAGKNGVVLLANKGRTQITDAGRELLFKLAKKE